MKGNGNTALTLSGNRVGCLRPNSAQSLVSRPNESKQFSQKSKVHCIMQTTVIKVFHHDGIDIASNGKILECLSQANTVAFRIIRQSRVTDPSDGDEIGSMSHVTAGTDGCDKVM